MVCICEIGTVYLKVIVTPWGSLITTSVLFSGASIPTSLNRGFGALLSQIRTYEPHKSEKEATI